MSLNHLLSWKFLGALAGMSLISGLLAQPSVAQVNTGAGSLNLEENSSDPFSFSNDSGSTQGLFNLFHRLNLANGMTMDQYRLQQREELNSATQTFREQQRRAILESQQESQQPATMNDGLELSQ